MKKENKNCQQFLQQKRWGGSGMVSKWSRYQSNIKFTGDFEATIIRIDRSLGTFGSAEKMTQISSETCAKTKKFWSMFSKKLFGKFYKSN